MSEVSVIETIRGPRKYLSAAKRMEIVQESLIPGANVAVVARRHNVRISSLIRWRRNALDGSFMGVKSDDNVVPASEVKRLKEKGLPYLYYLLNHLNITVTWKESFNGHSK